MRKILTKTISVFVLFLVCGCSVFRKEKAPLQEISRTKRPPFYASIPITKFSSIQCPCVNVEIGGTDFSMELDLGFRGNLAFSQEMARQISLKTFLYTKPMYGVRGKEYLTKLYRISKVKIGAMSFMQPLLQEETAEFAKDSVCLENGKDTSPEEIGRLGWELFYNMNLLIDTKHSQIAFCDSVETLKKQGYAIERFVKTPLILERGLVEFDAKTPSGVLRCLLDTGATMNMLHSETAEGGTIDQAIWKSENDLEYLSFQINDHEFGPVSLRRVPLNLPIPIDAILGMEFIRDHLIFLDFFGNYVYFVKQTN